MELYLGSGDSTRRRRTEDLTPPDLGCATQCPPSSRKAYGNASERSVRSPVREDREKADRKRSQTAGHKRHFFAHTSPSILVRRRFNKHRRACLLKNSSALLRKQSSLLWADREFCWTENTSERFLYAHATLLLLRRGLPMVLAPPALPTYSGLWCGTVQACLRKGGKRVSFFFCQEALFDVYGTAVVGQC